MIYVSFSASKHSHPKYSYSPASRVECFRAVLHVTSTALVPSRVRPRRAASPCWPGHMSGPARPAPPLPLPTCRGPDCPGGSRISWSLDDDESILSRAGDRRSCKSLRLVWSLRVSLALKALQLYRAVGPERPAGGRHPPEMAWLSGSRPPPPRPSGVEGPSLSLPAGTGGPKKGREENVTR